MFKILNSRVKVSFIILAILLAAVPGLLKVQADFSYRGYYEDSNPYIKEFDSFKKLFGDDSKLAIIIDTKYQGVISNRTANLLQDLTQEIWKVQDIARVDSLSNYAYIEADGDEILIEPFLEETVYTNDELAVKSKKVDVDSELYDYLISKNKKATMLIATFKPRQGKSENNAVAILEIRKIIEKYEGKYKDYSFYLAGDGAVTFSFSEISKSDLIKIIPTLFVLIVLILWWSFKSYVAVLSPILIILNTVFVTFGIAGYLDIKYSNIISAIPIIIVAISLADAIHILATYYQKRNSNTDKKEALTYAFQKNLIPTILTTLTTAVGFFSLYSAELLPVKGLGVLGGVGAIFAWIHTYLWLAIFLPMSGEHKQNEKMEKEQRLLDHLASFVFKFPKLISSTLIFASLGSYYISFKNEVNSDPLIYLSENVPFRQATIFMDEKIGGAGGVEVVVDSGAADGIKDPEFASKIDEFGTWLKNREGYTKVISYANILKKMNQVLNQDKEEFYKVPDTSETIAQLLFLYEMSLPEGKDMTNQLTSDYRQLRISGLWTLHDSKTILSEIEQIEMKLKEMGLKGKVSGKMPIYHSMNAEIVEIFFTSTLSALIGIMFILMFVFESVKIGIFSLIPNILPLGFGGMMMYLLGKPLDIGTVIVGAICLGIAVDDTIHFLSQFSYFKKQGLDDKIAIRQVFQTTGVALIQTTMLLILGFSSFFLADFVPNFNLGLGTIVILFMALVIDLLLIPALLICFSKERHER